MFESLKNIYNMYIQQKNKENDVRKSTLNRLDTCYSFDDNKQKNDTFIEYEIFDIESNNFQYDCDKTDEYYEKDSYRIHIS